MRHESLVLEDGCTPEGCSREEGGFRAQFANPTGALGWFVGHLMAVKNRPRNNWVLSLLDVRHDDHVLEIGFGPGVDIRRVAALAPAGHVAGIDHSVEMLRQATRRNAAALQSGHIDLRTGDMARLPFSDASFDKAYAINVLQFAPDPNVVLRELHRVLRPGGRVALALQPRWKGATPDDARRTGDRWSELLSRCGFTRNRVELRAFRPMPAVCVLADRSQGDASGSPIL